MIDTILFDLGNTLVRYYKGHEFPAVLERSLSAARDSLQDAGYAQESLDIIRQRAAAEDHEEADHRTRPLEGRLARIFSLDALHIGLIENATRQFMAPIFEMAVVYEDTFPALEKLRGRGYRIGIVSNSPWGCPASLLHDELRRLRLTGLYDVAIFCVEVGWRKPSAHIFRHALERMGAEAGRTLFAGDDVEWDVSGPKRVGMHAVLIDRAGRPRDTDVRVIGSLAETLDLAESL